MLAPTGAGAAGEALEDELALVGGHAGAVVLDGDQHLLDSPAWPLVLGPLARLHGHLRLAAAVERGRCR